MQLLYEKRKQFIKYIPKFWPVAILRNSYIRSIFDEEDVEVLTYLQDVDVKRYPQEPRAFTLELVSLSQY